MRSNGNFALHGYQPIRVDESLLSPEEKREALELGLRQVGNADTQATWESMLTDAEHLERARLRAEFKRGSKYHLDPKAKPLPVEFRFRQLAMLRAFARERYGGGRGVIFGDRYPC